VNDPIIPAHPEPATDPPRVRWVAGLLAGTLLWALAVVVAYSLPAIVLGRELVGPTYALVALLFAPLAFGAVNVGLRIGRCPLPAAGFTLENARADVLVGAAVAAVWATLQFLIIIPLTGGAARPDLVVNAEQIGTTISGLAAFVLLAWGGGFAEEVFFRTHLMTTLRGILGTSSFATALVVLVPTVFFALVHGYQGGWVGMLDTGVFGGATLSMLFLWRGRLLPCVVAHGLWSTVASVIIFVWY
jgi:membrane protease YdiL (CAAX protease family)